MPSAMTRKPASKEGLLLISESRHLGVGDISRYKITIDKAILSEQDVDVDELFIKIKNNENALLNPVYITGPYSFYCDIRPDNYNEDKPFAGKEIIPFVENLKPNEKFKSTLLFNEYSNIKGTTSYSWTIDVISQLAVLTFPKLQYTIKVGTSRRSTRMRSRGRKIDALEGIKVEEWDTISLWNLSPKYPTKPVHLVIITHGIFSNVGCDMLYVKDKIEEITLGMDESINPNIIIRGCMDNMGKSARGVHYIGRRVGKYVVKIIDELNTKYKVDKISFIGHSLGGPTQAMAVHYITMKRPDLFDPVTGVKPINFITLASPFVGVIGDYPLYISLPLDMGSLGLTGRDLNLRYTPLQSKDGLYIDDPKYQNQENSKLIMELLPQPPVRQIFEQFIHRTVYANVVHDGIVPLRTAALLYLDWNSLNAVKKIQRKSMIQAETTENRDTELDSPESNISSVTPSREGSVREIPKDDLDKKAAVQWAMPQALIHTRKNRKFERAQITETSSDSESDATPPSGNQNISDEKFVAPKEASTILSALSVLTAPMPTQEYIKNPSLRTDAIVHDRVYHPDDLPEPHYNDRSTISRVLYPNENVNRIQERIARTWQETMDWRKVLVSIQPDSHNNIIVRRRFVNLYGNVAINHLVNEHFGIKACEKYAKL
ncbi:similar to Saccharomyces cerevisiae YDR444W Putative protein of unknown function [Maudiozyma barnettii]|uniref:DUF676 domain-containing protein n=1 Tax=Maudiozyma barnettii TaxID=61262 RepID=A0A8H2VG88_9SACH|nr:putative hydrolase [Kazachstania barnettii]CAB4255079.1 similar to Saccharomyces cerevisiae YDR444W Putative protein of unknown function [Kazachstania barnettii]CAD1783350.1 similar to Saccharomyces cerevisiae YDR444W Putative protein of unknown function [Kazachstania barnettii]